MGFYGVASAGYWWGRLGAALVRLQGLVFGGDLLLWILLYADDFLLLAFGPRWMESLVYPLLLLLALGVPLS